MDNKHSGDVTAKELLEFAIDIEESAASFFADAAREIEDPKASQLLLELADEERLHGVKLGKLLDKVEASEPLNKSFSEAEVKAMYDFDPKIPETDNSRVGGVMLYAMKREKSAIELYETFSRLLKGGEFRDLCLHLASEETEHLAEFEMLYNLSKRS